MEVLTDSKSSNPVLLPNAELMELLDKEVKENNERLAKESLKQKKRGRKNSIDKDRKIKNKFEHRDWIQKHVLEYLKGTPCVNIPTSKLNELKSKCTSKGRPPPSPTNKKRRTLNQTADKSKSVDFDLTEAEAVQILNFMPQEPVEIHLMIEELHDRMSESKQEEFLEMIRSYNTLSKTQINGANEDTNGSSGETQTVEVVKDSIEMLEKAGNHGLDEGDTVMKIKEEI